MLVMQNEHLSVFFYILPPEDENKFNKNMQNPATSSPRKCKNDHGCKDQELTEDKDLDV